MPAPRDVPVARDCAARQPLMRCAAVLLLALVSACAYNKKLSKPVPLDQAVAIAAATDERLAASIDAVIVRDGPGSWSRNADWDEYLLHARATPGSSVTIGRVVVVDSLGERHEPAVHRTELAGKSKATARRYDDEDLKVTAGSGGALLAAGTVVGTTSAAVGVATLGSTGAAATAAAAGVLVVAPALMVAGVVVGIQGHQVQNEIERRSTVFPVAVATGQDLPLDVFFPLAPAPQRVEISYTDATGAHVLVIDTSSALAGLHLLPTQGASPGDTNPSP